MDKAKCPNCGTEFPIPDSSTESAGDNEGNFLKWAVKDIACPKCGIIVYKNRQDIYATGPGPW